MKRIFTILAIFFCSLLLGHAAKDIRLSVVSIYTYGTDGKLLQSGRGFFINANGTAIAPYSLFNNSSRAEAIDAKGKKYAVGHILGANSALDIVKFSLDNAPSVQALEIASQATTTGARVFIPNTAKAGAPLQPISITSVLPFKDFSYYELSAPNNDASVGLPVVNANDQIVGILQKNVTKNATTACALDARFFASLNISALSAVNDDLLNIHIPKALPEGEDNATSYIYLLNPADSLVTLSAINEYFATYPKRLEGLINKATFFARHLNLTQADDAFAEALSLANSNATALKADEVYFQHSKIIYELLHAGLPEGHWTYDQAIAKAQQAYAVNPNPLFLWQEGKCLYAKGEYMAAYHKYMEVNNSPLASAESYFNAATALDNTHTDTLRVVELMDSCVAQLAKPYTYETAQYLYARALVKIEARQYRPAIADLNEYEKAIGPSNLSAPFYFLRYQTEKSARMYQQALSDISFAQTLSTGDQALEYGVEEALLMLQVGMYDELIDKVSQLLIYAPQDADLHKIIGIAYGETRQRTKAMEHLQKAIALGDSSAETYIKRYKK